MCWCIFSNNISWSNKKYDLFASYLYPLTKSSPMTTIKISPEGPEHGNSTNKLSEEDILPLFYVDPN